MDLMMHVATHPWAKPAWLLLMLLLAGCNDGDSGEGGY